MKRKESITLHIDIVDAMNKILARMSNLRSVEDKLETMSRGLTIGFEGARDLMRKLHLDENRALQILINKEAKMEENEDLRALPNSR